LLLLLLLLLSSFSCSTLTSQFCQEKGKERKGKERKGRRRTTTIITSRKRGRELLLFLLLSSTCRKGDISGARSWEASSASSSSS
jgi:hypothetical protein